jgi:hypothetical protein
LSASYRSSIATSKPAANSARLIRPNFSHTTIGFLVDPAYPTAEPQLQDMQEAVRAGGLQPL